MTAFAPMAAGLLTGKYTRGTGGMPAASLRAPANQPRLTEQHLRITREVDRVADTLGVTSAQVAIAWVRQQDRRIVPVAGVRTTEQLADVLGTLDVSLPAEHLDRLHQVSRIEPGFPDTLLGRPDGQLVYGDQEPDLDLPATAPYRRVA